MIIGASLAGASAAVGLREQGYDGELTLIGDETELPYERPPLSKAVLLGDADEPDWVKDEAFYTDHRSPGPGHRRHPDRPGTQARGHQRRRYPYDKLLLATGSTPRRLDVPGADLDGLFTLRTYSIRWPYAIA